MISCNCWTWGHLLLPSVLVLPPVPLCCSPWGENAAAQVTGAGEGPLSPGQNSAIMYNCHQFSAGKGIKLVKVLFISLQILISKSLDVVLWFANVEKGICYRIQLCNVSTDVSEGKLSLNEPAAAPQFQVRDVGPADSGICHPGALFQCSPQWQEAKAT